MKHDPITSLTFGTGGLRGIMGEGPRGINVRTIRAATQGVANHLKATHKTTQGISVLIGYDSRHNSKKFAEETAKVFAGNGIKAYLFDDIRPVPLVSFGCRYKQCSAAVMITASHNPPQYNGYKVFWNDGAQVLAPHDKQIIEAVSKITEDAMVKEVPDIHDPLIEHVHGSIDDAYFAAIAPFQLYPEENRTHGNSLKIVYTSLHGTGITLVPQALKNWGFHNIAYVEEQIIPDGSFPTVKSPNPEEKEALKMGIALMKSVEADLLIATDPDADRVGIAVAHGGKAEILTGNQVACICLDHICRALAETGKLTKRSAVIKTIGTTELFSKIAESYGCTCFNVLTGFKYIAAMIRQWELAPDGFDFIFGGEESYGYLYGTLTRDKDAVLASALIAEAALHAKLRGETLVDVLHNLYKKHGVHHEMLLTIPFEDDVEGWKLMERGMEKMRKAPPATLNAIPVTSVEDYKNSVKTDIRTGEKTPLLLPVSDVLLFWLADGSKVMVRPSGTEPKVKIYCGVSTKTYSSLEDAVQGCVTQAHALTENIARMFTRDLSCVPSGRRIGP